jgi:hypothetical protein
LPVMRVEAEELSAIFGDQFRQYADQVPLFFPRPTVYRPTAKKFDMSLYMRYREYRAALGLLLAWSILAGKLFWGVSLW